MQNPDEQILAEITRRLNTERGQSARLLMAIAGPPASGKSTLAEQLCDQLNQQLGEHSAVVLPMDGFHLDNEVLDSINARSRKGAPHTFDIQGFKSLLNRTMLAEHPVLVPVFDRSLDLARAAGRIVLPEHRVVIVEGNYLLLDQPEWSELAALFDFTVFLQVDEPELRRRLVQRWLDHGLDPQQAAARAQSNDLPNALLVMEKRLPADKCLTNQIQAKLLV